MSKTIIQRMYDITRKMQNPDPEKEETLLLDETRMKKAEGDLRALRKKLGLTTMQVIILTTNLDKAFERRFLYKIRFDKPSLESRGLIWRSMLPELSEQQAFELSSSFHFSGGQIENIVRKKMVYALLNGTEPGFEQVRSFCKEEGMGESSQVRRVGF